MFSLSFRVQKNHFEMRSLPGKMMEQLILDVIAKQVEEKKVIRSSQHGFTKGKSCLTNLIAFYDGMTSWVDERRAVDVVHLDFSEAFNTVSHILIGKLRKCGLDEWSVRWIEEDERDGTPPLRGKAGRVGAVQPGEEKDSGRPYCSLPVPEGGL